MPEPKLQTYQGSNFAVCLITLERSGRLMLNFQKWWIWVRRWALLIYDDALSKIADLSEVKRSNFAVCLITLKCSCRLTYQRSKNLNIVRSDGYGHEDQMIGTTTHSKMANLSDVKRFNFTLTIEGFDLTDWFSIFRNDGYLNKMPTRALCR